MPGTLRFDPDYQKAVAPFATIAPPTAPDTHTLRNLTDAAINAVMGVFPSYESHVTETILSYPSTDGTQLALHRFDPVAPPSPPLPANGNGHAALTSSNGSNNGRTAATTTTTPMTTTASSSATTRGARPAVLYLHGGGHISGSPVLYRRDIVRYAHLTKQVFFAPSYRLAPEHPFPTPFSDCYAALSYLHTHAADLGIDPSRIAIMGLSAGGGLAVAVALKARDEGKVGWVRKLVLVCPMLDDRTRLNEGAAEMRGFLTWTEGKNRIAWGAYLGGEEMVGKEEGVDEYAAPGRARYLGGMPRTYVDVGGLDLFRGESLEFAGRLAKAGGEVEVHVYPGVPHAWEWVAVAAPVTKRAVENRVSALKDL
ncbi:hypothetical protein VTI74DRAFT_8221 [Chaetomium olivicolor]